MLWGHKSPPVLSFCVLIAINDNKRRVWCRIRHINHVKLENRFFTPIFRITSFNQICRRAKTSGWRRIIMCFFRLRGTPPPNETWKLPKNRTYPVFKLKRLYCIKYFVKLYQTCNVASKIISCHVRRVWSLYHQTGNRQVKCGNIFFWNTRYP